MNYKTLRRPMGIIAQKNAEMARSLIMGEINGNGSFPARWVKTAAYHTAIAQLLAENKIVRVGSDYLRWSP